MNSETLDKICIEKGKYGANAKACPFKDGDIRYIRITDINANGSLNEDLVSADLEKSDVDKYQLKDGDLLFARSGATVGKTFLYQDYMPPATYAGYLILFRPDKGKVFPKYLFYYTKTKIYENWVQSKQNVVAQPNINAKQYGQELKIPLPALQEQKRIAAILDKADALKRKKQKALDLCDQFLKALFIDMFASETAKSWDKVTIEYLSAPHKGSMRTGPFGSSLLHSEFVERGIAVLGIDNAVDNTFKWKERRFITEQKYRELKRYTVYPNDVIITIMGTTGRSAVIPDNIPVAINTKHLACITLNKKLANPIFISFSIHSSPEILSQINQNNKGAIMNGLNLGIIKKLKLSYPPIKLQNKFAEIVKKTEAKKAKLQQGLEKLNATFNALSQKAFKGEL